MTNVIYEASGNLFGTQNVVDGRKDENELLARSNNWIKMVSRGKNFVRNIFIATALKTTFESYCGCLTPVEGSEESRAAFNEWAKHAGLESGESLAELTAQLVGVMTWGDCLVVLGADPYAAPGTITARLKLIDPLRVETPPKYKEGKFIGGKRVVLGVVLDKHDIEIGYFVRKAGTDGKDEDFDFLPRYDKNGRFFSMLVRAPGSRFPGQVRSFPMLSGSMNVTDVLNQLVDSAAIEGKSKSNMSVMLASETPPESGKEWTDKEKGAAPKLNLSNPKPGAILTLPPGTKPYIITNTGNLNLVEQIRQQLKLIAGGLGIPYAAFMSDFEKMNFSSSKMALNKLFKIVDLWNYGPIQRLFGELFYWVCYEHYLINGILPKKENLVCDWIGPTPPDPDPLKSANAERVRLASGTLNPSDAVAAYSGTDYAAHCKQRKKDEETQIREYGAPFGLDFKNSDSSTPDDDDDDAEDEE
ncbi:MAG: phage portal protein [Fibromonadales bacterium]|nr:phage portal protein [Fibromonadales bacterium]